MGSELYVAASGYINMQKQLDVASNNLANVNTPGFKKDRLLFQSYLSEIQRNANAISRPPANPAEPYARTFPREAENLVATDAFTDFEQGTVRNTGNDLDLSVDGDGFFVVEKEPGKEAYTRAGNFKVGPDGALVNPEGLSVLSVDGKSIYVRQGVVNVHPDGSVWVSDRKEGDRNGGNFVPGIDPSRFAGRVKVVRFENPQNLKKEGEGLFSSDVPGQPVEPSALTVRQGFLEQSNVNAIEEMTQMIEIMRRSESYQKVIQSSDEMTGRLLTEAGRAV